MSRLLALAVLACTAACSIDLGNGQLTCASNGGVCPEGLHCAADRTCWRDGEDPVAGVDFGPLSADGEACAGAAECASRICSPEGVCCHQACDGVCESCVVPGSAGTCTRLVGPPRAGASCGEGQGACAGACDGSSASCVFGSTTTPCGGDCTGRCDGAGQCAGGAQGACAGGFACGPGGCRVSCGSNADCQPLYMCDTATMTCVRFPESSCFNGVDDNSDGLADCADPTCVPSRARCVAAPGAQLGVLAPGTTCTSVEYATKIRDLRQGLTVPPCTGATCTPETECNYVMRFYAGTEFCADEENSTLDARMMFPGRCAPSFNGVALPLDPNASMSILGGNPALFKHCNVAGTPTSPPPVWARTQAFCGLSPPLSAASGCAAGQRCVPIDACRIDAGNGTCASPDFDSPPPTSNPWHTTTSGTRTCNAATCTPTGTEVCPSGNLPLWRMYSTAQCSFQVGSFESASVNGCNAYQSGDIFWTDHTGDVWLRNFTTLPLPNAACTVSQTSTGTISPSDPWTVCCP